MTNEEYNDRLFSLIQRNANCPFSPLQAFDLESRAKTVALWCSALMSSYQSLRRKQADTREDDPRSPAPSEDEAGTIIEAGVTYDQIAWIFKVELKEYLERAQAGSRSDNDKSLFAFMLSRIESPLSPAEPKQAEPPWEF